MRTPLLLAALAVTLAACPLNRAPQITAFQADRTSAAPCDVVRRPFPRVE